MALGVMVAGLAGYVGFLAFVAADRAVAAGTMFLAAATGFAAFFSPCSFPLLLTFLSRRAAESRRAGAASALAVGTGAAALLALIALVIGLGGEAIAGVVTFDSGSGRAFRLTVGLLLVMFGLRQTRKLPFRMSWLDRVAGTARRLFDRSRFSNRVVGDVVYGFGYLLAGFGCTGPLLAGLAAQSLTIGAVQAAWAVATAAVVFIALLVAAAVTVTSISDAAMKSVRMAGPAVRSWGGFVLVAVGAWFVLLAALPSPIIGS